MNSLMASHLMPAAAASNSLNANSTSCDVSPGYKILQIRMFYRCSSTAPTRRCFIVKFNEFQATDDKGGNQTPKLRSVICPDCDGNGAIVCSQCKGGGVNQVEFFNGQFKVGDACWLCGGRNEMLCGNCNGAGFTGGFMSTADE